MNPINVVCPETEKRATEIREAMFFLLSQKIGPLARDGLLGDMLHFIAVAYARIEKLEAAKS